MELEFLASSGIDASYEYANKAADPPVVDWGPMFRQFLVDLRAGVLKSVMSAKFHNTLADIIVDVARRAGQRRVALTGGCFQNRRLTERTVEKLGEAGFRAYWHQRIPPNDGGIALGQLCAARQRVQQEKPCVLQYQAR
jgi:hydrogenase maturation protein HypF